jgi:hypothetical protein
MVSVFLLQFLLQCRGFDSRQAAEEPSQIKALNTSLTYVPKAIQNFEFRSKEGDAWGPLTPSMVANKTGGEAWACPNCAKPAPKQTYGPEIQVKISGQVYTAQLKVRGGITIQFPRKSLTMKFKKGGPFPTFHGVQKNKIVLNASYNDPTYLRQFIVFSNVIMQGGYAPYVDFAMLPIAGDFGAENKGRMSDPNIVRNSLYIVLEDWQLAAEDIAGKGAHILKSESDCSWSQCQPGNFEAEGKGADIGALVAKQNAFCEGADTIDRTSYFRRLYINHFFKDVDSITKNYILFTNPKVGGKFSFFHWDQDATMGFSPDGAFYGNATDIFTPEPWGRKNNNEDTWQQACFRSEWKETYVSEYRTAMKDRGLNAGEILTWLANTGVKNLIRDAVINSNAAWENFPEGRRPDNWETEIARLEDHLTKISAKNQGQLGL